MIMTNPISPLFICKALIPSLAHAVTCVYLNSFCCYTLLITTKPSISIAITLKDQLWSDTLYSLHYTTYLVIHVLDPPEYLVLCCDVLKNRQTSQSTRR